MSNEVKMGAVVRAVVTLLSTGLAFGEQLLQAWNALISGQDNGGQTDNTRSPGPKSAEFVVEMLPNADVPVGASVSLNGERLGEVFSHQEPHLITETIFEGRYNYTVTYYDASDADSAQYSQYSADASGGKCAEGTPIDGDGEISVSDGDRFAVFDDCEDASLQEMN